MLSNVFLKGLRERRVSMIWWAVGIGLTIVLTVSIYPSMRTNTALQDYANQSSDMMTAIAGTTDFVSPVGYLNSQLFFLMLPIILGIFAIAIGSDALAGEEGRGTLDLLLSAPLPRRKAVLEKFATMLAGTVVQAFILLAVTTLIALAVSMNKEYIIQTDLGELVLAPLNMFHLVEATLALTLLALAFGSLALMLGAATGNKGLSIGVTAAFGLGSMVFNSIALIVKPLKPWRKLTPIYYYNGRDPMTYGLDWHVLVLVALTVIFLAGALFFFERRDLKV